MGQARRRASVSQAMLLLRRTWRPSMRVFVVALLMCGSLSKSWSIHVMLARPPRGALWSGNRGGDGTFQARRVGSCLVVGDEWQGQWRRRDRCSLRRHCASVEDQREHDEEEGGGGAQQEEADRDTDVEAGGGEGDEEEGGNDGGRITNALDLMETLMTAEVDISGSLQDMSPTLDDQDRVVSEIARPVVAFARRYRSPRVAYEKRQAARKTAEADNPLRSVFVYDRDAPDPRPDIDMRPRHGRVADPPTEGSDEHGPVWKGVLPESQPDFSERSRRARERWADPVYREAQLSKRKKPYAPREKKNKPDWMTKIGHVSAVPTGEPLPTTVEEIDLFFNGTSVTHEEATRAYTNLAKGEQIRRDKLSLRFKDPTKWMDERLASGAEDRANLNSEEFYLKRKAARSLKARRAYAVRRLNGNSGKGRPKSRADQASQKEAAERNGLPWPLPPGVDADGNEIVEPVESFWPRERGRPIVFTVQQKVNPRGRPRKKLPPPPPPPRKTTTTGAAGGSDHSPSTAPPPPAVASRQSSLGGEPRQGEPKEEEEVKEEEEEEVVMVPRRGRGRPRKVRTEPRRPRGRPRKLAPGETGDGVYIEPEEFAANGEAVKAWMAAAATEAVVQFPSMAKSPMTGPHVDALAIARTNEVTNARKGEWTSQMTSIAADGVEAWMQAWKVAGQSAIAAAATAAAVPVTTEDVSGLPRNGNEKRSGAGGGREDEHGVETVADGSINSANAGSVASMAVVDDVTTGSLAAPETPPEAASPRPGKSGDGSPVAEASVVPLPPRRRGRPRRKVTAGEEGDDSTASVVADAKANAGSDSAAGGSGGGDTSGVALPDAAPRRRRGRPRKQTPTTEDTGKPASNGAV